MSGQQPQRRQTNVSSILLTQQENECLFNCLGRKCIVSCFLPSSFSLNSCMMPCYENELVLLTCFQRLWGATLCFILFIYTFGLRFLCFMWKAFETCNLRGWFVLTATVSDVPLGTVAYICIFYSFLLQSIVSFVAAFGWSYIFQEFDTPEIIRDRASL